ncbi:hypothetical protein BCR35DRAFT_332241 [Leucosporidium creatinivorum]|uniref:Uncharacterized protein n=1 Tax=Leucosporidium creatinivorum TaxID=106004 RepID=A0A1Y2F4X8_9BASI|nr:hypothetical protein BCR35DRAFT_332241 [Leucosporidium creatinivorum]
MRPGKLKQRSVARWLQQATCQTEVAEILSAYIYCKMRDGATPAGAGSKLYHLMCYLHGIGLGHIVNTYRYTFALLISDSVRFHFLSTCRPVPTTAAGPNLIASVANPSPSRLQYYDGGLVGANPTTSTVGNDLWNEVRRGNPKKSSSSLSLPLFRSRTGESTVTLPVIRVREGAVGDGRTEITAHWGAAGPGPALLLKSARVTVTETWPARARRWMKGGEKPTIVTSTLPVYDPSRAPPPQQDSADELPDYGQL